MLPQTWEDPSFANTEIEGAFGDNDPGIHLVQYISVLCCVGGSVGCCILMYFESISFLVDVVEIGGMRVKIGDVIKVKPLAAVALIDEGELDWKIVAISLDHPRASLVNDANDVEKHFPVQILLLLNFPYDFSPL